MIHLSDDMKKQILQLASESNIYLEGNFLKMISADNDDELESYIKKASELDKTTRKKRLEITKQIQDQNNKLIQAQKDKDNLLHELEEALKKAETARESVQSDLDILQKKTQTELISTIVKVSLWMIIGIGVMTTILYFTMIIIGKTDAILGSAWSNMLSIILTNSFSIIGTIMGVKYATKEK